MAVLLVVSLPSLGYAQDPAPPAQEPGPRIHIGGYIQYDYLAPLGDEATTPDTFRFRRVRLIGYGPLTEHIDWSVTVEATTTPILRDACLTLKYLPGATIRAGQFVMPYGIEQYVFSSNTMAFTERVTTEIIASRDAGVAVFNERPFFGWLHYAAGIANGTRQNVNDNNSEKDGMVRLTAAPQAVPGFQVSINAMKGDQPDGMRTRTGADVSFERRLFHVAAEYDQERTGTAPRKRVAYVFGAWRFYPRNVHAGFHHFEVGTRLARTRQFVTPINQMEFATNYYVRENVRFLFEVIKHTDRTATTPPATIHARVNFRF